MVTLAGVVNHAKGGRFDGWTLRPRLADSFRLRFALHIVGNARVLRAAISPRASRTRSYGCVCGFGSALAHQPFATQKLDFCDCRSADRGQFRLRVSHRPEVTGGRTKLSCRPAQRLRHGEPYEPRDLVGLGRDLCRRILFSVFARTHSASS